MQDEIERLSHLETITDNIDSFFLSKSILISHKLMMHMLVVKSRKHVHRNISG